MCLVVNKPFTKTIKSFKGTLTVYKVFRIHYRTLHTKVGKLSGVTDVYLRARHQLTYRWIAGVHKALGARVNRVNNEVHKGIHACLSEQEAKTMVTNVTDVILKFQVPISDVIGIGTQGQYVTANNKLRWSLDAPRHNQQIALKKLEIPDSLHRKTLAAWKAKFKKSHIIQ